MNGWEASTEVSTTKGGLHERDKSVSEGFAFSLAHPISLHILLLELPSHLASRQAEANSVHPSSVRTCPLPFLDPVLMSLKEGYKKSSKMVFKAPIKEKKSVVVNGIDLLENVPPRTENEVRNISYYLHRPWKSEAFTFQLGVRPLSQLRSEAFFLLRQNTISSLLLASIASDPCK